MHFTETTNNINSPAATWPKLRTTGHSRRICWLLVENLAWWFLHHLSTWSFMENLTWQFLHQLSKYLPAVEGIHYLAVSTSPLGLCAGCLMENITWQFLHPLHRGTNTNCSQRDHSVTTSFEQLVHLFRQTEQKTKTKNTVSSNWFVCSGKLTPQKQKKQKKQQHSFKQLVCLVKQTDKTTTTTKTQPT